MHEELKGMDGKICYLFTKDMFTGNNYGEAFIDKRLCNKWIK